MCVCSWNTTCPGTPCPSQIKNNGDEDLISTIALLFLHEPVHSCVAIDVLLFAVGSLAEEVGGDGHVVVIGRPHEWSHTSIISHVDVKVGMLYITQCTCY